MIISSKEIITKDSRRLTLRSVEPSEAEAFLRHQVITGTESYKNLNRGAEHWGKVNPLDQAKFIESLSNSKNSFMMVAVFEDRIVGGLGLFGHTHDFTLQNASLGMSIQNEFAGIGLGSAMLEHAFSEAKKMKIHRIDLTVRTYNTAGIALYEKMGFERIGLFRDAALIDGEYVNEFAYQILL